jgi:CelD/BcsL family acetyltransferase involved in cellulose biosynthesis
VSRAELLPIEPLSELELGAWRELAEVALEPNPFFNPDFVLAAATGLHARGVGLLATRNSDGWTGCLPVTRVRGWRRVPLRGLVTWNHLYCFLGTPLVRPGAEDEALKGLLDAGLRQGAGFLGLDLIATDGPVNSALGRAVGDLGLRPVEIDRFRRATLRRREEGAYLGLTPKRRRNFERLRRRLEGELGGPLSLRDRSDDPVARADFLRLEASGWKGTQGTGTALAPSGHGALFEEICAGLAARGMLQLVAAEANGTTVAMLCNLIAGDTAFTFKIASADDLSQFSPGIQLEILYLDHFHSTMGLKRADSCAEPSNQMINRLWPDRREIGILAIPRRGIRGAMSRPALGGVAWLRRRRRS